MWAYLILLLFYVGKAIGQEDRLQNAQLRLYANARPAFGKETSVVVTVVAIPKRTLNFRINTPKYLLAYGQLGPGAAPMGPKFVYTSDINEELKRIGIYPSTTVSYRTGFFAEVKATFFEMGRTRLSLTASDPNIPSKPPSIYALIDIRSPHDCTPVLNVHLCQNPDTPLEVKVDQTVWVKAYFLQSCGLRDPPLNWTIYDVIGTEILHSYPQHDLELALKRYTLRFKPKVEMWRNLYMIMAEGIHKDIKYAVRCYVKVILARVEAIISGGEIRRAYYGNEILVDGSLSRDYSKLRNETQFVVYNWDCGSYDDYQNSVCHKKMSKDPQFTIPANSFHLGNRYEFTLVVASEFDPSKVTRTWQHLTIVGIRTLYVDIVCIANCENAMYNPRNKVLLMAKCLNCGIQHTRRYSWFLNGMATVTTQRLTMFIHTDQSTARIRLDIRTDDGRYGTTQKILTQNIAPRRGRCNVNPTEGVESQTRFFVCCMGYQTHNIPITYFFYANRVVLNQCLACNCPVYLPHHLKSIKVLVCDNIFTCRTTYVPVKVTPLPNVTLESPEALWNFLINPPNNLIDRAQKGHSLYVHQLLGTLASGASSAALASVLVDAYELIQPGSVTSLGKLANFTHTLAAKMTPIDQKEQKILVRALTKLNSNFDSIFRFEMHKLLVEEPFVNVTVACVTVYNIMQKLNKHILRPPQNIYDRYHSALKAGTLNQTVVDQLMDEIKAFGNDYARERSMLWLNSTWQTERLYGFLYLARRHGLQADKSDVTASVTLDIQCFFIEKGRTYTIATRDQMHEVTFSPELLQERKEKSSNRICVKVISTLRELHWWYPEEKQPSSILLSVRIFVKTDHFKNEIILEKSELNFTTVFGKYKPAVENATYDVTENRLMSRKKRSANISSIYYRDRASGIADPPDKLIDEEQHENFVSDTGKYVNCLREDSLKTMTEVRIYRMSLDEESMLVVRFMNTSHKLQVLLIFNELPKRLRSEMSTSGCTVPAHSADSKMLLRNNCADSARVYLAVRVHPDLSNSKELDPAVPLGPAFFSFVFQVRSCDYWVYSKPKDEQEWSHANCKPGLEYPRSGTIHCTCKVLGTYTSYVHYVNAIELPTMGYVPVAINWILVIIYIILIVLLLVWMVLLFAWYNKRPGKTVMCDMTGLEGTENKEVHDLLVTLKTGGRDNAQTTAAVRLIFETVTRSELQFTLMQDPQRPELRRNSTYIIWLRSRDIRIPTRVAVAHNNDGRYPSWYLWTIEVADVQANLKQVFIVRRWVHQKFLVLSSALVLKPGDKYDVERWRVRFAVEFERQWVNWGLFQPLTGMWRENATYDSLTRAERVCIFLNKMMVTYCVCACYLGPTTPETAYADRGSILKYSDLVDMFLISAVLTNLLQFLLEHVIIKQLKKKNNIVA